MKQINTINTKELPYPTWKIWEAIIDVSSYPKWWPSSIRVRTLRATKEIIGSQVEVKPYGGQAFLCEVIDMKRNENVTMKYSGIYSGTGVWTITASNRLNRVTYEIALEIKSIWIRFLSTILPIASIHSRLMDSVLSGLERHLAGISSGTDQEFPADRR
jgi:ribosome-associated toxin RatA of RatAB toxin-antitoxin module